MVEIERLGPDSWQRVRALRLRALEDAPDAFWSTLDEEAATTPAQWRQRLERSDAATFVARDRDADVGLAVVVRHHESDRDAGLRSMWVAPEARGKGVARELITHAVGWARTAGHRVLRLYVADTNTSGVKLYERLGFNPTGRTATFPHPRQHISEHERALDL